MSEKRRPDKIIVAEKQGKTKWIKNRIELFSERQWGHVPDDNCGRPKYRVRMNGKWVTEKRFWTLSEIMAQTRKWLLK
jgi:hypothetical protein